MDLLQQPTNRDDHYEDWHLDLDFQARSARIDLQQIRLTRKEYQVLEFLVKNAGEVVPSKVMLARIFGYCPEARTRTLHVHIRRLREKIGPYSTHYIETIFGVGYRFQPFRPTGIPGAAGGRAMGFPVN